MSTITKEQCITSINEFLKSRSFKSAMELLNYYLELEGLDNNQFSAIIQLVNQNPDMVNLCIPKVLKELEIKFSLTEVSKNNNPILVY